MALPIKSNSTQDGCNPTSSNCVIWQGPDIPCINLCNGDTISDVVAKLAEKLCVIIDQLDISAYDLSCFNPICPNPTDFQALVQFLIDKICTLENIDTAKALDSTCPDECIVTVASCLRGTDALGNSVTELSLKDYVIKIGNEICTILTSIASLNSLTNDLAVRVTYIEENCCNASTSPTVPSAVCISGDTDIPIVTFVVLLEAAFCELQTSLGDIGDAIATQCVNNTDFQLAPYPTETEMQSLGTWSSSPTSLENTIGNLWLTICDLRTAVSSLQTELTALTASVSACCDARCSDIIFTLIGSGIVGGKNIKLDYAGSVIPSAFDEYCGGASGATVTIEDAWGNTCVTTVDILAAMTGSGYDTIDLTSLPCSSTLGVYSVYYRATVNLCLSDGSTTCNNYQSSSFNNAAACPVLSVSSPASGQFKVDFTNPVTSDYVAYDIQVFNADTNAQITNDNSYAGTSVAGAISRTFTGLASGNYKARVVITHGNFPGGPFYTYTCGFSSTQVVA